MSERNQRRGLSDIPSYAKTSFARSLYQNEHEAGLDAIRNAFNFDLGDTKDQGTSDRNFVSNSSNDGDGAHDRPLYMSLPPLRTQSLSRDLNTETATPSTSETRATTPPQPPSITNTTPVTRSNNTPTTNEYRPSPPTRSSILEPTTREPRPLPLPPSVDPPVPTRTSIPEPEAREPNPLPLPPSIEPPIPKPCLSLRGATCPERQSRRKKKVPELTEGRPLESDESRALMNYRTDHIRICPNCGMEQSVNKMVTLTQCGGCGKVGPNSKVVTA